MSDFEQNLKYFPYIVFNELNEDSIILNDLSWKIL